MDMPQLSPSPGSPFLHLAKRKIRTIINMTTITDAKKRKLPRPLEADGTLLGTALTSSDSSPSPKPFIALTR